MKYTYIWKQIFPKHTKRNCDHCGTAMIKLECEPPRDGLGLNRMWFCESGCKRFIRIPI